MFFASLRWWSVALTGVGLVTVFLVETIRVRRLRQGRRGGVFPAQETEERAEAWARFVEAATTSGHVGEEADGPDSGAKATSAD